MPVPGLVLGTGTDYLLEQGHAPPYHARLCQLSDAQHAVNAFAHQVGQQVVNTIFQLLVGVVLEKGVDHRQQRMLDQGAMHLLAVLGDQSGPPNHVAAETSVSLLMLQGELWR